MKRRLLYPAGVLVLLAISAILAGCSGKPTPTQIIKDVTVPEALALVQQNRSNPDFIIVDVRTPAEFAQGHIQRALNIDIRAENFQEEISKLERNKIYLVYCRSGVRSRSAVNVMQKLGFTEVYNLSVGISQWIATGLPTAK